MKRYIFTKTGAIAAVMAFSLAASGLITAFEAHEHIRETVVRLHILANSDSPEDQELKLKVRDGILACSEELFEPYSSAKEAEAALSENMEQIKAVADRVLAENNSPYRAYCEMEQIDFDTRVYDGFTVPAGKYTALRVKIGSGEGKNWWCVMYPPLCIPCAGVSDEEIMEKYGGELTEEDLIMLTDSCDFEARLYIIELIKKIKDYFKR